MSSTESNSMSAAGRSWRDIRQEVTPLAMSRKGRSRRRLEWFKVTALFVLLGAGGWGIYTLVHSWETDRAALATAVHSEPVRDIALITDGVLTKKWAAGILALPKTASLMSLDLEALRNKLLENGQVRVAVLTRHFPDTLVLSLQERTPVARLQASDGNGPARQLFVSREGVVYDGINYGNSLVASLPWLAGIRLVKAPAHGFEPITGMEDVSALLSMAQLEAPQLYRTWQIVSLDRLEARDEILVKARDIAEIVFTRKRDFRKQIAELDYVVDRVHVLPDPALLSVNLAIEGQVPVRMRNTPEELAKLPDSTFSPPSPQQRKSKRDL
jgi:cell division protein FtsQ